MNFPEIDNPDQAKKWLRKQTKKYLLEFIFECAKIGLYRINYSTSRKTKKDLIFIAHASIDELVRKIEANEPLETVTPEGKSELITERDPNAWRFRLLR